MDRRLHMRKSTQLLLSTILVFVGYISLALGFESNLPLDRAARAGDVATVARLLTEGANPNEINSFGGTALTGACGLGANSPSHTKVVQLLLTHGADVNLSVINGTTALNEASFWGNYETVRVLLDAGADANVAKDNGYTPLLGAASRGHADIVRALIAAGADKGARTSTGLTALHLASTGGFTDVVELLKTAGADTRAKSTEGETYQEVAGRSKELQQAVGDIEREGKFYWGLNRAGTVVVILVSFVLTWGIGLAPALSAKYLFKVTPMQRGTAIGVAVGWWLLSVVGWSMAGSTTHHGAQILIAFVTYKVLTSGVAVPRPAPAVAGADASEPSQAANPDSRKEYCPSCFEFIGDDVSVCRYCGHVGKERSANNASDV